MSRKFVVAGVVVVTGMLVLGGYGLNAARASDAVEQATEEPGLWDWVVGMFGSDAHETSVDDLDDTDPPDPVGSGGGQGGKGDNTGR